MGFGASEGIGFSLPGKVALVTGGSRGIGAATVRLLRQAGARVVFSYLSAVGRAQQLVEECGGEAVCRAVQQELASAEDGEALVMKAASIFGAPDIVVVNHGVWPPHNQPIETMSRAQWRSTLGVNLESVFGAVSAAAAQMKAKPPGLSTPGMSLGELGPARAEAAGQDATAMTGDALYGSGSASGETPSGGDANARELLEEMVYSDRITWPAPSAAAARDTASGPPVAFGQVGSRMRGHIVLVASTAAQRGEAFHADYAASKGALLSLTKSLSSELAPQGILCNCVAPGWVRTEMSAGTLGDPDASKKALGLIPLGRAAEPEEIAGPIVFLCTPWAGFISGEIWNVNGGAVLVG